MTGLPHKANLADALPGASVWQQQHVSDMFFICSGNIFFCFLLLYGKRVMGKGAYFLLSGPHTSGTGLVAALSLAVPTSSWFSVHLVLQNIAQCCTLFRVFVQFQDCHVGNTPSGDLFPAFCTKSPSPLYSWTAPSPSDPGLSDQCQTQTWKYDTINYQNMSGLKSTNRSEMMVCLVEWRKHVGKLTILIRQLKRLSRPWLDLYTKLPKIPFGCS